MGATGLGALAEGLQGGMAARDKHDMQKQYRRILADRADIADRDWQDREDADQDSWYREHSYLAEDQRMEGYSPNKRTKFKDPALLRMAKKFGGAIKGIFGSGGDQEADFVTPEIQPTGLQASGAQTQGIPGYGEPMQQGAPMGGSPNTMLQQPEQYADGGYVGATEEEERMRRSYGDEYYVTEEEAAANQEAYLIKRTKAGKQAIPTDGEFWTSSMSDETFDDTRRVLKSTKDTIAAIGEGKEGASAGERGDLSRQQVTEQMRGIAGAGGALVKDVAEQTGISGALEWAGGFIGQDGGGDVESAAPTGITPEADTEDPAKGEAVKGAIDAPDQTDGEIAETAMSEGQQYAMENMDFKLLKDQGVRPEDLPTMTTREWADHRSRLFQYELGQGRSVKEAQQNVEFATVELQQRGMQRELDKSIQYLATGQMEEAAMALQMGFQYFPNGSSMKIGMMKDPKTGLPAIIAMGVDEETGEPKGSPMIISADRLSAMRAQMSDPKAFSAWTKDGHQLQIDIAKMNETEKHNTAIENIGVTNAKTARMRAETGQASEGAMTKPESRQRSAQYGKWLTENLDLLGEESDKDGLLSAMELFGMYNPSYPMGTVKLEIMNAYRAGQEEGIGGNAGVERLMAQFQQQQQTGIPEG